MKILKDQTTNTAPVIYLQDNSSRRDRLGDTYFLVAGVFAGATLTISVSADKSKYIPLDGGVLTDAAFIREDLPEECYLKFDLTGVTGTTNIDVDVL